MRQHETVAGMQQVSPVTLIFACIVHYTQLVSESAASGAEGKRRKRKGREILPKQEDTGQLGRSVVSGSRCFLK